MKYFSFEEKTQSSDSFCLRRGVSVDKLDSDADYMGSKWSFSGQTSFVDS